MANPASRRNGPKGGSLARSAAMLSQDKKFMAWLDVRRNVAAGTHDEEQTTNWLRSACRVESRAELDHSEYGRKMFRKIMRTYLHERGGES